MEMYRPYLLSYYDYKLLSSGTFDWGQMIEGQALLFSIDIL